MVQGRSSTGGSRPAWRARWRRWRSALVGSVGIGLGGTTPVPDLLPEPDGGLLKFSVLGFQVGGVGSIRLDYGQRDGGGGFHEGG